MLDKEKFDETVSRGKVEWRKHSLQRMLERNISRDDAKKVIAHGEAIEEYPNDKPFPSVLFYKSVASRPLHVVAAFDSHRETVYVITVYEPTLDKFEPDFKTRRKS